MPRMPGEVRERGEFGSKLPNIELKARWSGQKGVNMEYLNVFQEWLYQTRLYQDFLKNMPPPINNVYFDTFLILLAVVYFAYRIVDAVRIVRYRKKARKRMIEEQAQRKASDRVLHLRETEVRDKEEKIGRFMDVMEMYFRNKGRERDAQGAGKHKGNFWGRLGRRESCLLGESSEDEVLGYREYTDYDRELMEEKLRTEQEAAFRELRRQEREQMGESLTRLEREIQNCCYEAEPLEDTEGKNSGSGNSSYEKRKARALKQARKEQEKARRIAEKAAKRGGSPWNGKSK